MSDSSAAGKDRSHPTEQNLLGPASSASGPFTGGYYWFPEPGPDGVVWSVLTCEDLGCGPDDGHDEALWPRLLSWLAIVWNKDDQFLKRRLQLCYTGLPRGRVTRPGRTYLILHGNDSPPSRSEELLIKAFRLDGQQLKFLFDEHETQIPGHPEQIAAVIGSTT